MKENTGKKLSKINEEATKKMGPSINDEVATFLEKFPTVNTEGWSIKAIECFQTICENFGSPSVLAELHKQLTSKGQPIGKAELRPMADIRKEHG